MAISNKGLSKHLTIGLQMRGTRLRLLIKNTTQHSIMKLLLILCFLPLLVQAQLHDTIQRDRFKMWGIHTMEQYETTSSNDTTSTPVLLSVARINPEGFMTQITHHGPDGAPGMQYMFTYLYDSILIESRLTNSSVPAVPTSVTTYTYNQDGLVQSCRISNKERLATSLEYVYSKNKRLKKINQILYGNPTTGSQSGTGNKTFKYNEKGHQTEMREVRHSNGKKTKESYQYIYDQQGNKIETRVKSTKNKKWQLLEKREYDPHNRLTQTKRYYYTKTTIHKGSQSWTLQPSDAFLKQWMYNDQGLIEREHQGVSGQPTVIITSVYKF